MLEYDRRLNCRPRLVEIDRVVTRDEVDRAGIRFPPYKAARREGGLVVDGEALPAYEVYTEESQRLQRTVDRYARVFDWILKVVTRGKVRIMHDGHYVRPAPWRGDLTVYIYRAK